MDKLIVKGGYPLRGSIAVSGSKNTALPLMAAALLVDRPVSISNIPNLRDIKTFSRVIGVTGAGVSHDVKRHEIQIDASTIERTEAPYELVKRMRASFYMLGALLARSGKARVSLPGGCAWGPRPVDLHLRGMEALGAHIELEEGYVVASAPDGRLPGGYFRMDPSSVGATINVLLAAVRSRGESRIENAAIEPDVVVLCEMLQAMGAEISGIGTHTLRIQGKDRLNAVALTNCPDRIELGTFMIAAAIAGEPDAPIVHTGGNPAHLGEAFLSAFRSTGASVDIDGDRTTVYAPEELQPVNIETGVYPGFPTDLQAQWTVLLARTNGNAKVRETIYPDRFKHIPELRRMGVNAIVVGDEVSVEGGNKIQGAQVMSTDLRASVSLVLAALVAEGETHIQRVYHLDRGYENLEGKLKALGASIERVQYDEWADPVLGE